MPKNPKMVIFHRIQKWFVPSGPDFYAISKWGFTFLYLKNWRSYEAKCKFLPILYRFCKNGSGDHIHASIFENRVTFFPQGTKLSAEIVFRANNQG